MFTLDQIAQAHSKVKSGADFPAYIRELIALGVLSYETFVADGHTRFRGSNSYVIQSPPKYDTLAIAAESDSIQFIHHLKFHQQGGTNYLTFCGQAAGTGVNKWAVDTVAMTCTYYDLSEQEMLVEQIPA